MPHAFSRHALLPAALVGVVGTAVALVSGSSEMLFPCLAALAFAGRRAWQSFDSSLGRTVTSAPEGLVVTSGLGTLTTRTLRRGRTHAVRLDCCGTRDHFDTLLELVDPATVRWANERDLMICLDVE